ncbi:hypothetical protein LYSHEL_00680 [Lysobacter helvus]|uniref:Uncharacterized protein n=2 Tax=Lysobacteraceae TaxID=32033 RepID=A0ABM7Q1H3_9GAMM|nr:MULTISPECIES: hypothetical protein [Lysobacter]BCT91044.1 hypothetical protein LYSCAS_00680 [Lysobacter caseinilyticus]BCT94197.1 hypothetical protein LYSHEL_00680 [Lysobacter helvus]
MRQWTADDFDALSWHDVHVHGFRIESADQETGTAELILDIDFLLEWRRVDDGSFEFDIAPATLQFHDVFGLRFQLDFTNPGAGMGAFSIERIEREQFEYPNGHTGWRWTLPINWPSGRITFEASGFTQRLTRAPIVSQGLWLDDAQRHPAR